MKYFLLLFFFTIFSFFFCFSFVHSIFLLFSLLLCHFILCIPLTYCYVLAVPFAFQLQPQIRGRVSSFHLILKPFCCCHFTFSLVYCVRMKRISRQINRMKMLWRRQLCGDSNAIPLTFT